MAIIIFSHQKGAIVRRERRLFCILLSGSLALNILFYYPMKLKKKKCKSNKLNRGFLSVPMRFGSLINFPNVNIKGIMGEVNTWTLALHKTVTKPVFLKLFNFWLKRKRRYGDRAVVWVKLLERGYFFFFKFHRQRGAIKSRAAIIWGNTVCLIHTK